MAGNVGQAGTRFNPEGERLACGTFTGMAGHDDPELPLPPGADEAAAVIDEQGLAAEVAELEADVYEGRGPGTEGDSRARRYLAQALAARGFQPAGERGFEQPFSIVGVRAQAPSEWTFRGPGGGATTLRRRDDFIVASGVQAPRATVEDAELVFVGYGIRAPEENWNDFAGAEVRGKVVVVLNGDPDWDPERFGGAARQYYGRWTYKFESAAREGAAGAILIHTTESAGYPWQVVQRSWSGPRFELPAGTEPRAQLRSWITEDAARALCRLGGHELDALVAVARRDEFRPVPLGVRTSIVLDNELETTETANVIGVLPGRDPSIGHEVVALSAHHDHLGRGAGGEIYPGARDNGAGIAQALAVARALEALPERPRRSAMVVFVGAEEQGLLGSAHFARHPTVPRERLVADINFEMGNMWGPTRDVIVHGAGKTDLEELVAAAARRQGRVVASEPDPEVGWYYRSDQWSFARAGIPAIWFESGTDYVGRPPGWGAETVKAWIRDHYHRPSDRLTEAWDFGGMVLDAKLAFYVTAAAATSDRRPRFYEGVTVPRLKGL
jgi:Zn-dependent M28 family amino/carboxypeptidase